MPGTADPTPASLRADLITLHEPRSHIRLQTEFFTATSGKISPKDQWLRGTTEFAAARFIRPRVRRSAILYFVLLS